MERPFLFALEEVAKQRSEVSSHGKVIVLSTLAPFVLTGCSQKEIYSFLQNGGCVGTGAVLLVLFGIYQFASNDHSRRVEYYHTIEQEIDHKITTQKARDFAKKDVRKKLKL